MTKPRRADRPPCWCNGACPHTARALELETRRQPLQAEIELHRVLTAAPDCWQARSILARLLASENRAAFAVSHLDSAIGSAGPLPELLAQRALALRNGAQIRDAIPAARVAVAAAPDDPYAWQTLIAALREDGRIEEGRAAIAEADQRFTDRRPYRRVAGLVESDAGDLARALFTLQDADTPIELFDRGRVKEKMKNYRGAWSDWMEGKSVMRANGCIYDAAWHEARVALLCEIASPDRRRYMTPCAVPPERPWPIFITGFPRSGTTMIEATLSSHRAIVAGDELPFLLEVIQRMPALLRVSEPYPRALMAASFPENAMMLSVLRDFYVRKSHAKIGAAGLAGKAYFTDKMVSNEKHWFLISLLFPQTPIVHLRRHPLDIIVSNMSYYLEHGGFFSCALDWCAHQMLLLDDLMMYYREVLPELNLREVRYENFVVDHKTEIDAMTPADLAPDPACYDFHLNEWHSRTISARQIKAPVHASSVRRFEPFLEFLQPIIPTIAPILQRQGYSI